MERSEVIALSNSYTNGEERGKLKNFFSDFNQMRTNRRTIVFSTPSETGTSYFRIFEPMLAIYRSTDEFNLVYTEKLTPMLIELADLVVAHRAGIEHDQLHSVVKYFQRDKIRPVVVHNVDDNEFNLPASHPMRDMWITAKKDKMSLRSIRESDFIETTTNKLVNTFKQYNRNVELRRNRFNWSLPQWNLNKSEKQKMFGDKFVIGWCGLTSHFQDLVKMKPILKYIQDKYPFVHIILAGMAIADKKYEVTRDPKTNKEIITELDVDNPAETYRERVKTLYGDLDQDRISIFDAVGLEEYGKFYSWMDLGIAYIEHNGFNACKSPIKSIEYNRYGSPCVYSDFGGYRDYHQELDAAKILDDSLINNMACAHEFDREWIEKISFWTELWRDDKAQFESIGDQLRNFVSDFYSIDNHIHEQIHFYNDLIDQKREREFARIDKESAKYDVDILR
jgi:hypothetical protein